MQSTDIGPVWKASVVVSITWAPAYMRSYGLAACLWVVFAVVMDQLMNDEDGQQAEAILDFAKSIHTPTLVLWGENDKVSMADRHLRSWEPFV